jgi:hypothetical protein
MAADSTPPNTPEISRSSAGWLHLAGRLRREHLHQPANPNASRDVEIIQISPAGCKPWLDGAGELLTRYHSLYRICLQMLCLFSSASDYFTEMVNTYPKDNTE